MTDLEQINPCGYPQMTSYCSASLEMKCFFWTSFSRLYYSKNNTVHKREGTSPKIIIWCCLWMTLKWIPQVSGQILTTVNIYKDYNLYLMKITSQLLRGLMDVLSKALRCVSKGPGSIPGICKTVIFNILTKIAIFGGVFCTSLVLKFGWFSSMFEFSIGTITVQKISLGHDFFGCILFDSLPDPLLSDIGTIF